MNADSQCRPGKELLDAYLAALYQVILADAPEEVRIGHVHPRLDRMTNSSNWTIITAFNPGSRRLAEVDNHRRHRRLQDRVEAAGFSFRHTRHLAPDASWPDEEGLFIIGSQEQWIHEQARHFGQLGVVHGAPREPAELWLYGGDLDLQADHHPHVRAIH